MTGTLGAGACKLLEAMLVVLTGPYADLTACKKDIHCSCPLFLMVVKFLGSHVPALFFSFMTERKLRRRFLLVNPHLIDRVDRSYDVLEDIDGGGVECGVLSEHDEEEEEEDKLRKRCRMG